MNRLAHWTPRYVGARLQEMAYARLEPDKPWLTRQPNLALESLLKPTDKGLEFGSGRSTVWFAQRLASLTSVEHDRDWHDQVAKKIATSNISNVTYVLRPAGVDESRLPADPYVAIASTFADASLDSVLVDGAQRGLCAEASIPKIRSGGLLVVDNVNWYLPSASLAPNSRSLADGPRDDTWRRVDTAIRSWRRLWTTNHVSDTGIFFKP